MSKGLAVICPPINVKLSAIEKILVNNGYWVHANEALPLDLPCADKRTYAFMMGASLSLISHAALVMLSDEWVKSRECRLVVDFCDAYDIPYKTVSELLKDITSC